MLLGVGGMLYRAWAQLLDTRQIPYVGLSQQDLELTRPETIDPAIPPDTRLFINVAAYTDVDGAEKDEHTATLVNATGVGHLAAACRQRGALLVHYSTDYVFDGQGQEPYPVNAPRAPLNAYGRSKAGGEVALEESGCDYLLLRTSWLYAPWGRNFVQTIVSLLQQKRTLRIVSDQTGRPTSSEHLASASLALVEQGARGILHVTDGGQCTWFDFAREIARLVGADAQVDPCTTAELARPARRPAYSVLDLSRTEALIGPMPDWTVNLEDVVRRMIAAR